MKKTLLFAALGLSAQLLSAQDWEKIPQVFSSHISVMTVHDNLLFIGGNFTKLGTSSTTFSVTYNGTGFSTQYDQFLGGTGIGAYTVHKGELLAGGFLDKGSFARMVLAWDGSGWDGSGYNMYTDPSDIISYHDTLFVTASLDSSSSAPFQHVAYFTGGEPVTAGKGLDEACSFIQFKDELFAFGGFTKTGNTDLKYSAKWKGGKWISTGATLNSWVSLAVIFKEELYIFGNFTTVNGQATKGIAKFNGTTWAPAGGLGIEQGPNGLRAVTADEKFIYVAGDIKKAGGNTVSNAAAFDGTSWYALGTGLAGELINTLQVYKENLYAGSAAKYTSGSFDTPAYLYKLNRTAVGLEANSSEKSGQLVFDASKQLLVFKGTNEADLALYDLAGNEVWKGTISESRPTSVQGAKPGVYLAKIGSSKGTWVQKVLISAE